MKINIKFNKIDISVANIVRSVRLKFIWQQEKKEWIKAHESAFCYMSKGWSSVKKDTSYCYKPCPKLHIAFFTSWLINNTFIILLNNEYMKISKKFKGYIYTIYIICHVFNRSWNDSCHIEKKCCNVVSWSSVILSVHEWSVI